jgi:hypothetical protein
MRHSIVVGAALLAVAFAWLHALSDAAACSVGPPDAINTVAYLRASGIVAIGTLHDATADTVRLRVEEGLKGAVPGDEVTLTNHHLTTDPACGLHVLENDPGGKYHDGQHIFAMLTRGPDGDWWPAVLSIGVQELPEDDLVPVVGPWGAVRLSDTEQRIRGVPVPEVLAPDGGCGLSRLDPAQIEAYRTQSVMVLEGVFGEAINGRSVFGIGKVIAGTATVDSGVMVQNRQIYAQPPDCVPRLDVSIAYQQGQHMLLFLRPNELGGEGPYRVAGGGAAAVEINAEYLTWGMPTLRDFRRAAEDVAGAKAESPVASGATVTPVPLTQLPDADVVATAPGGQDSDRGGYIVAITAGLGAAGSVAAFGARR